MTFLFFVIFGYLEGLAIFYLCCSLFRFRANSYVNKFMFMNVLITTGNFLIRQEESFSSFASLFSLLMIILFLKIFLDEVSLLWATIIGLVGFVSGGLIQATILFPFIIFNVVTVATIQDHLIVMYILQLSTAIIMYFISQALYKRGIGFTFNLDRFKLTGENIVMLIILIVFLASIGIIFSIHDLFLNIIVLLITFTYLLYFAIKKQKKDASNSPSLE